MDKTIAYSAVSAQQATLHLFNGRGFMESRTLGSLTVIGRSAAENRCDIILDSPFVSRKHGQIAAANGQYFYKDMGSTNGTYVNGKLLGRGAEPVIVLQDGDIISYEVKRPDADLGNKIIGLFTRTEQPFNWQCIRLTADMAELCVGRGVSTGLAIDDLAISHKHASFFHSRSGWAIIDHNSTNGVFLNGKRITYPRYLAPFDVIRIAGVYFVFLGDMLVYSGGRVLSGASGREIPETGMPAHLAVPDAEAAAARRPETGMPAHLAVPDAEAAAARRSETGTPAAEAAVRMPGAGMPAAEAAVRTPGAGMPAPETPAGENAWRIAQPAQGAERSLEIGLAGAVSAEADAVSARHFGMAETPEVQPQPPETRPMQPQTYGPEDGQLCIDIVGRSVVQRFKRMMLLQDIKLTINRGEMVLILGGSGAGKTTFMNAVMGYEKAEGKITYRDTDIYEEYEQMKFEIGYVHQQNLVRDSDTVYDTLSNAAEMKLPKRISAEKREKRIDDVLEEFGLSEEKYSLVSKISGGQKRRLCIAVEYISDPSLFFLDEPDSGLDDITGEELMKNLRRIADRGKIVMVITHSPERAGKMFDKVIVLAKSKKDNSGHLAFYGSIDEAFRFFGVSSYREIIRKVNRENEGGEGLADYYIDRYQALSTEG